MIYVCLLQLSSALLQFTFTSETMKLPRILQGKLAHRKASLRTKESAKMNNVCVPHWISTPCTMMPVVITVCITASSAQTLLSYDIDIISIAVQTGKLLQLVPSMAARLQDAVSTFS